MEVVNVVKGVISAVKYLKTAEPFAVVHVRKDFREVKIAKIEGLDEHFLDLSVCDEGNFKILRHSLPDATTFTEPNTIEGILKEFHTSLNYLVPFYTNLAKLDDVACVLEPPNPTTKDCYRVIKYDERVYIRIELSPKFADEFSVAFIGPSCLVASFIQRKGGETEEGDDDAENNGFLAKLLRRIGKEFFLERNEGMFTEKPCSICLEMADECQKAPLFSCENLACGGKFHRSCLKDYIKVQKNRKVLGNVTGTVCPIQNCKNKIEINF